uniref:Uncharacterized protein n=1 Tax=Panagrolaimus davidi TaxID=227884 RepID=A0A914QRK4_9BILA
MATKRNKLLNSNKISQLIANDKFQKADCGNQYSNFNMNQNCKCPVLIHVQTCSKSIKDKNFVLDGYDNKFKQKLLNKSSDLYSNTLSIIDKVEAKKNWKSSNTNESILSLHISVYENSLEAAAAFDSINAKNVALKKNKIKLNKLFYPGLFVQNPFEFPRQQEANQKKESKVMKFKANQKLLNPVQTNPSKNVQITNSATAGSSAPAQMPISSNNNNNENENVNINVQPGSFVSFLEFFKFTKYANFLFE